MLTLLSFVMLGLIVQLEIPRSLFFNIVWIGCFIYCIIMDIMIAAYLAYHVDLLQMRDEKEEWKKGRNR